MFTFHRPKVFRSVQGCCICKAKSSSTRFTDSKKYEEDFVQCFQLSVPRQGEICNACVLLVKRFKRLPPDSDQNWGHVVDARVGPGLKSMSKFKKRKEEHQRQQLLLQQQNGPDQQQEHDNHLLILAQVSMDCQASMAEVIDCDGNSRESSSEWTTTADNCPENMPDSQFTEDITDPSAPIEPISDPQELSDVSIHQKTTAAHLLCSEEIFEEPCALDLQASSGIECIKPNAPNMLCTDTINHEASADMENMAYQRSQIVPVQESKELPATSDVHNASPGENIIIGSVVSNSLGIESVTPMETTVIISDPAASEIVPTELSKSTLTEELNESSTLIKNKDPIDCQSSSVCFDSKTQYPCGTTEITESVQNMSMETNPNVEPDAPVSATIVENAPAASRRRKCAQPVRNRRRGIIDLETALLEAEDEWARELTCCGIVFRNRFFGTIITDRKNWYPDRCSQHGKRTTKRNTEQETPSTDLPNTRTTKTLPGKTPTVSAKTSKVGSPAKAKSPKTAAKKSASHSPTIRSSAGRKIKLTSNAMQFLKNSTSSKSKSMKNATVNINVKSAPKITTAIQSTTNATEMAEDNKLLGATKTLAAKETDVSNANRVIRKFSDNSSDSGYDEAQPAKSAAAAMELTSSNKMFIAPRTATKSNRARRN